MRSDTQEIKLHGRRKEVAVEGIAEGHSRMASPQNLDPNRLIQKGYIVRLLLYFINLGQFNPAINNVDLSPGVVTAFTTA